MVASPTSPRLTPRSSALVVHSSHVPPANNYKVTPEGPYSAFGSGLTGAREAGSQYLRRALGTDPAPSSASERAPDPQPSGRVHTPSDARVHRMNPPNPWCSLVKTALRNLAIIAVISTLVAIITVLASEVSVMMAVIIGVAKFVTLSTLYLFWVGFVILREWWRLHH